MLASKYIDTILGITIPSLSLWSTLALHRKRPHLRWQVPHRSFPSLLPSITNIFLLFWSYLISGSTGTIVSLFCNKPSLRCHLSPQMAICMFGKFMEAEKASFVRRWRCIHIQSLRYVYLTTVPNTAPYFILLKLTTHLASLDTTLISADAGGYMKLVSLSKIHKPIGFYFSSIIHIYRLGTLCLCRRQQTSQVRHQYPEVFHFVLHCLQKLVLVLLQATRISHLLYQFIIMP